MKYKVLCAYEKTVDEALRALERAVEKYCTLGWEPQGGIEILQHESTLYCRAFQAMIKREE